MQLFTCPNIVWDTLGTVLGQTEGKSLSALFKRFRWDADEIVPRSDSFAAVAILREIASRKVARTYGLTAYISSFSSGISSGTCTAMTFEPLIPFQYGPIVSSMKYLNPTRVGIGAGGGLE